MNMVNTNDLETVLESETGIQWSVIDDKPNLKRFTAVSFEYRLEYYEEKDGWRFNYDDAAKNNSQSLGRVDSDDVLEEFRDFVQNTFDN